jgi:hypothetical protein
MAVLGASLPGVKSTLRENRAERELCQFLVSALTFADESAGNHEPMRKVEGCSRGIGPVSAEHEL